MSADPDLGAMEREARADAALWRRRAEDALDGGDFVAAAFRHRHALGCERQADIAAMLAAGADGRGGAAADNDNGAARMRDGFAAAAYGIAGALLGAAGTAALCLGFSG